MKLPAVAIAAAFAAGIALGLCAPVAHLATSPVSLGAIFSLVIVAIITALLFVHRQRLMLAALLSLCGVDCPRFSRRADR